MRTMGNVDTSWLAMKRFLGQRAAKEDILRFDARMITAAISADLERRFFLSHSTHSSHMSEPILAISHLSILFLSFFCFSLTRPISPICQSPFFPYLTF